MRVIVRWKPAHLAQAFLTRPDFLSPLPPGVRIAILGFAFRETKFIRCFPREVTPTVLAHQPDAIAASISVLRALARTVRKGALQLPNLGYALIVLTEVDGELISQEDRDLLWQTFGLPIYEQLIDPRGEVLAMECEAHQGLHVTNPDCPAEHLADVLGVALDRTACGCGRRTFRFVAKPVESVAFAPGVMAAPNGAAAVRA